MTKIHRPEPTDGQRKFREELAALHEVAHGDDIVLLYENPSAAYMGRRTSRNTDTTVKLENVCSVLVGRLPGGGAGAIQRPGGAQMGRALIVEPPAGGEGGLVRKAAFPTTMPTVQLSDMAPADQMRLLKTYIDLVDGTEKNVMSAIGPDPVDEEADGGQDPAEA